MRGRGELGKTGGGGGGGGGSGGDEAGSRLGECLGVNGAIFIPVDWGNVWE